MNKYFSSIIVIFLLLLTVIFNDNITNYFANFFMSNPKTITETTNNYYKDYDFKYAKNIRDFTPYSYGDLINILYTVLNSGWDNFTFYCPKEYESCIDDIKTITKSEQILTDINNYVHPYNNFNVINTSIDTSGEISIFIEKIYSKEAIKSINNKLKEIEKEIWTTDMDITDKLKSAHDYIVSNSKYDMDRKDNDSKKYQSNIAYGPILEGYAICSGYADAMAIFISDLGIKNYKIASSTHIWNAIYYNDQWLHIDPTWDDQIDNNGNETLIHKFFLINTENMLKYASDNHNFDVSVYREYFE